MVFCIGSIVTYTNGNHSSYKPQSLCAHDVSEQGFKYASVIAIANKGILALTFIASLSCVSTSLIGLSGLWYKQQPCRHALVSLYHVSLWLCLALIAAVAYVTCDIRSEDELGAQWREELGYRDHLMLQSTVSAYVLHVKIGLCTKVKKMECCGYAHPMDYAAYKGICRPESLVPGCSYKMYLFQQAFLSMTRKGSLVIVPIHIFVIVVASLYSHHVEHLFSVSKSIRSSSGPFPKRERQPYASDQHFYDIPTKLDDHCPACVGWSL